MLNFAGSGVIPVRGVQPGYFLAGIVVQGSEHDVAIRPVGVQVWCSGQTSIIYMDAGAN